MRNASKPPRRMVMWLFLTASLTLNVAGAAWAVRAYLQQDEGAAPFAAAAPSVPTPVLVLSPPATAPVIKPANTQPNPAAVVVQKFQWSSVEADDYSTYISRLRGIACPESTIKNIITGELREELAPRRTELERRILRSSDWSPPRGISRQEYFSSQIRKLEREIELTVSKLMQTTPELDSQETITSAQPQSLLPAVHYPAAMGELSYQDVAAVEPGQKKRPAEQFKYIAPGVVEATPEQIASLEEIQAQFVRDLGNPNQDVEDPQYEENWKRAQRKADQLLRARHGWAAHSNLTRAAIMKSQQELQQQQQQQQPASE